MPDWVYELRSTAGRLLYSLKYRRTWGAAHRKLPGRRPVVRSGTVRVALVLDAQRRVSRDERLRELAPDRVIVTQRRVIEQGRGPYVNATVASAKEP